MSELISLKKEIEKLNTTRQKEILRILIKNKVSISENKNGSFINLTMLDNNTLNEIKNYMKYISDQEETIAELESVKHEFQSNYFVKDNKDNSKDKSSNGVSSSQAL